MRYLRRKVLLFIATLWAALTLNFALPRLMPGSPVDAALAKLASAGVPVTNAERHAIEIQLGSPHGSVFTQYWDYLTNLLHFNFIIGTLLGVYAGWRRGTVADSSITVGATFLAAFPPFWLGLLAIYWLSFTLGWFPLKGGYSAGVTPNLSLSFLGDAFTHSVLPALALAITSLSGWVFGMRNNMINTLGEDYVTFAEANGLRTRTVALLYAARNALLPNVTAFGLSLGAIIGGSVLVEGVFSYPGLGNLLYIAVSNHDFPLMQALFLVITLSMLLAIFVVDLLYVRLDPRVRQ